MMRDSNEESASARASVTAVEVESLPLRQVLRPYGLECNAAQDAQQFFDLSPAGVERPEISQVV